MNSKNIIFLFITFFLTFDLFAENKSSYDSRNEFSLAAEQAISENNAIEEERKPWVRLHLALNDYRINNGRYPENLNELVPSYFESIPINPKTGKSFVYEPIDNGTSFKLEQ